jgi:hypothetical protein
MALALATMPAPTSTKPRSAGVFKRVATQADVAEAFGVTTRTIQMWLTKFPELRAAVNAGGIRYQG